MTAPRSTPTRRAFAVLSALLGLAATIAPAGASERADPAAALHAAVRVAFPSRHGAHTVVEPTVAVATSHLVAAKENGDDATFRLALAGEIRRDEALIDRFRYRFEVPTTDAGAALPLIAQRTLRPGSYRMTLRVDDLVGGGAWRVEQRLVVPSAASRPAAERSTSDELETAFRAAEAARGDPVPTGLATIDLLLPLGEVLTGPLRFEARVSGPVDRVVFDLAGRSKVTRRQRPFAVELDLGALPRSRTLTVTALDAAGRVLARDEALLNAGPHRFTVRLVEPRPGAVAERSVTASVAADLPVGHHLERVELFLGDRPMATLLDPPFTYRLPLAEPGATTVVRAVGVLDDGTTAEDTAVVNAPPAAESVSVNLVEVYTTVVDRRERPVAGLDRSAFTVFEDGQPQVLRRFEPVFDLPVHATILLDTSASMAPRLAAAREAALRFFERAVVGERDRLALIAFSDRPSLVAPYTGDEGAFRTGLANLLAARSTALYDSLIYALYYQAGLGGQRALLLISDGDDEISRYSLEDVLDYARRAQVTIYTVGLDLGGDGSRRTLARLADETGGRSFLVGGPDELDAVYATVLDELRARYLLVYQSPSESVRFRSIEVRVDGRGLRARAMRGYHP